MSSLADAGLFSLKGGCGASKSCGCASTCQPECCKPVIVRPCGTTVHTYQRKCSTIKPPCCDTCCPSNGCAPACAAPAACAPAPACAAPAACAPAPACAAPAACAPAPACAAPAACAPAPACAAPAACAPAPACAAPAACAPAPAPCAPACAAPAVCAPAPATCAAPCAPAPATCAAPCAPTCGPVCCADPCEIAKLIYQSQTACYAKDRRAAIHKLGDRYDCVCNPEIMHAFVYALNDTDERVRRKAADEIGDQLRKNPCCCNPCTVAALTCSLGDCDKWVRRQAEQALKLCGYEIVDGCCTPSCTATCGTCAPGCGPAPTAAPMPMPMHEGAPAPVPPESARRSGNSLSNLLGMLN
ncbi:MAG: HEAT repeat domain-containing protein [Planctomycetaceae bacterium]|nr:HEAT repeat domain-containing protein [Planctomycetaceae bacterium]